MPKVLSQTEGWISVIQNSSPTPRSKPELHVGDTIWMWDENRRVYPERKGRAISSGPIWREHWRPVKIISESVRSFVLEQNLGKISKNTLEHGQGRKIIFRESDIAKLAWLNDNRVGISDHILHMRDSLDNYEKLLVVAEALGMSPTRIADESE